MKMKKLLSIGALTLAVVCSTAVGASAAERPSNADIKKDMEEMYLEGKNPLNYNLNSNKTISNFTNKNTIDEYAKRLANYPNIVKALTKINPDKTVKENAQTVVEELSADELKGVVSEARSIAVKLRDIENAENSERKLEIETEIKTLIETIDGNLNVYFGRNIDGKITMSIMDNNDKIIIQLNSGNAYTISNSLKGDNIDRLIEDAKTLLG